MNWWGTKLFKAMHFLQWIIFVDNFLYIPLNKSKLLSLHTQDRQLKYLWDNHKWTNKEYKDLGNMLDEDLCPLWYQHISNELNQ